jgi:PAS domain S-box-containing protein
METVDNPSLDDLRRSEWLYRSVVDNLPICVLRTDREGRFSFVNDRFCHVVDKTRQEIIGKTYFDLNPSEVAQEAMQADRRVFESGCPAEATEPRLVGDQTRFMHVVRTPVRDEAGAVVEVQTVCVDVTELECLKRSLEEQAVKALRDSQAVYESLVESVPLNVLRKDLEGRFVFANRAFCQREGRSLEEILGKTDLDLYPQPLAEKYRADDRRIIETGETYEDVEAHEQPGGTHWVQVVKTPVRDAQGAIVGTQAIFWDVTSRRRAEEELRRYSAELEISNRELEQFTAVVSHDLHAPLRAVATYCELLEREYADKLDMAAQEYISFARQSIDRMHALIEDLRSLTRVTTRGKQLRPVDSQEAVDAALINLGPEIERSGARVTHGELPTVLADGTQLMQLFQNLIGNAIKYTKGRRPVIQISAVLDGTRWRFGVRDNGIGIAPQDIGRLFVIFQRLHADEEEYSGTGVGLALCKRIVERHGGQIWVESRPDMGSTFYFTIP